jgi:hypothetical protein
MCGGDREENGQRFHLFEEAGADLGAAEKLGKICDHPAKVWTYCF